MRRKVIVYSLALILMLLPLTGTVCAQQSSKMVEQTAKARAEVLKRGTGEKARVSVRLRDGAEVKGYISEAGQDRFTVTDRKTQRPTEIAYSDVLKVKGKGLGKGAKIGIIAAIGGGLTATYLAVTFARINGIWR